MKILLLLSFLCLTYTNLFALEKVSLQLRWDHQFQFAGYYAADWQGYYQEEGLEVDIKTAILPDKKIVNSIDAVASQNADFGIGSADILIAQDKGLPLVIVASIFQKSAAALFRKASTSFNSLADLTRLKVARRVNALVDIEMQVMLRAEGIDPDLVIPRPHQPGIQHLLSGKVDIIPGYTITDPFSGLQNGVELAVIKPSDYGINFYGDSLFTHQQLVDDDPEQVHGFIRASLKGWQYAFDHSDEIAEKISQTFTRRAGNLSKTEFDSLNKFQADRVQELSLYPLVEVGHINPRRWQSIFTMLKQNGIVSGDFQHNQWIFDPVRHEEIETKRWNRLTLMAFLLIGVLAVITFLLVWDSRRTARMNRLLSEEIRDRKSTEKALIESEEKWRSLTENSPDYVMLLDKEAKIQFVNRTISELKIEDILGKLVFDFAPVEIQARIKQCIQGVFQTGKPDFYDADYSTKDGKKLYFESRIVPIFENGQIVRVICSSSDVTDRKLREQKFRENEELLEKAEDIAQMGTWKLSLPGNDFVCSKGLYRLFELDPAEVEGSLLDTVHAMVHPEDLKGPDETALMKAIAAKESYQTEYRVILPNGNIRHMIGKGEVICDEKNEVREVIGSIRDVTENKNLENQLRQAQKMEAIGVLTGGIAHEFNNLLSPIMGYTELLIDEKSQDDPEVDSLKQIQIAGSRAKELVQQMLAYGRQSMSQRQSLDLKVIVESAVQLLKNTIDPRISVKVEFPDEIQTVWGMPDEIRQVLLNLCINAKQAMPEGGELTIHLEKAALHTFTDPVGRKREGQFIELIVKDDGVGMNSATLSQIFDPFFSTKEVGQGSGLGLSVVQGIVEQHEGHIKVHSTEGKGSAFHIYFPVAIQAVESPPEKLRELPPRPAKILLIDDEAMIVKLTKRMLEKLGYEANGFLDCDDALKSFSEHSQNFDLVMTDYGMPKMNGKAFAKKIKEIRPDIPVLIFTGYGDLMATDDIREWGVDGLVTKPFQLAELSEVLEKILEDKEDSSIPLLH
ncbi:MAG: ABC transporter substrate-binding protein [SAR324 cluster bacterium]|nr:ABC transporter substrate-binding protein [SAR324 cluster bacterium]